MRKLLALLVAVGLLTAIGCQSKPPSKPTGTVKPVTPTGTEATKPGDMGKPDSGKPDSGKPDSGKPDSGKPDSGKPDSGKPEGGGGKPPQ